MSPINPNISEQADVHITSFDEFLLENSPGLPLSLQLSLPVYRKFKGQKNIKKTHDGLSKKF